MHDFKVRIETKTPFDVSEVWGLAEAIERMTKLVVFWTVTSYHPGLYFLAGEVLEPVVERPERKARVRLTAEEKITLVRLYEAGVAQADLARQFRVSQSLISLITKGLRGAKVINGPVNRSRD